ncbi:AI-2E family transporter [Tolumonas lignilytica]|uniref:AI-2E family transporter n=1 Tax=Tolumonas lignilytica TaxID=1283284 RepID=UPI0004644172|nr:AI-2E family transporter [Tolumonas lignilytica]
MLDVLLNWYRRRFSDPNAVTLFWLLVGSFTVIYFYGGILAPVLAALVIAYLLEWFVQRLMHMGLGRRLASTLVVLLFIGLMLLIGFGILPTVFRQGMTLVKDVPNMLSHAADYLKKLPQMYPGLVDASLVDSISGLIQDRLLTGSGILVSFSFASLMNLAVVLVYMVLVPLLIFFMLKDKDSLLVMTKRFLPYNRQLVNQVWKEMNTQIANYIRGKVIHILIVSAVNFIVFAVMGINFALLLGISVGISVLIPYIGAVAVTIPVTVVALFQWGISPDFAYLMLAYAIVQTLDANLLTPLLFSETMNLHPIAIILAVLVFGGIWGFWGVFFAIPLATLVKAVVNSWPGSTRQDPMIGSY